MIITEIQNSPEWYSARRGQIRATDFYKLYNDVINPSTRSRKSGIEMLLEDKVYGISETSFDENYAKNGHVREPAIIARLEALLECKFLSNQTAIYDNNNRISSSLDGYCDDIVWDKDKLLNGLIAECKTTTINSKSFERNFVSNCKKWKYQALHHLYCTDKDFDYKNNQNLGYFFGIEFQEYMRDADEQYFTNNKDFIAINFLTNEIICSDFEHDQNMAWWVKETLKEHLVFDTNCTREIWEQICNDALAAIYQEKLKNINF